MITRAIVISNLNNKLIVKTKGGTRITWSFIPNLDVGDDVFVLFSKDGKATSIEPISCQHAIDAFEAEEVEIEPPIDYSELDSVE